MDYKKDCEERLRKYSKADEIILDIDTSEIETMDYTFASLQKATSLDLSSFSNNKKLKNNKIKMYGRPVYGYYGPPRPMYHPPPVYYRPPPPHFFA